MMLGFERNFSIFGTSNCSNLADAINSGFYRHTFNLQSIRSMIRSMSFLKAWTRACIFCAFPYLRMAQLNLIRALII